MEQEIFDVVDEQVRTYIGHFFVDYLKLPDREVVVLLALKSFAWNQKTDCFPSIKKLAELTNKSERRVSEILSILESKGLIIVDHRIGRSNLYRITNIELKDEPVDNSDKGSNTPDEIVTTPLTKSSSPPDEIVTLSNIKNNKREYKSYRPSDDDPKGSFNDFWKAYPKRVKKIKAERIWAKEKLDHIADVIIEDVKKRCSTEWNGRDKQYIPNPNTYLNDKGWTDEIITNGMKPQKTAIQETPTSRYANMQDWTKDRLEREKRGS